ncbi:MAG TPA: response regulator [Planctomycetota bacterium]|nr:response regulator [Planctomycetota bacterium]
MKLGILIVDDSLTVRMDLDEAFRNGGFATTLCGTAAAARDALSRSAFALVVLDVLLPDADGVEFLKEFRASPGASKIPVMLLSTEAEVRDRIRGLKTGADEYVGKPYDPAYLVSRGQELVRRSQPNPEGSAESRILIIDDSRTFREGLKTALEGKGYAVTLAESGEEGLRVAVGLRPRAVIVDGVLPGIDGATVIRRLRQDASLRRTPCILLTASEDSGGELRALESGADAYVRKEEDIDVVLTRLAAVLRSSDATQGVEAGGSLLGPKKILAVDDSATYLQELGTQLRQEGYEAILAPSGEEALELLAVQPVDCILLDVLMPGLSGHETCRRLKSSPGWRDIPVLMLTAREDREAMIEGINAGADDYISKSSDFDVLKARLRAQLRRKQFEDENRHIREQLLQKELEAAQSRAAGELAETRARLLADLEQKNQELESFSYSVSHDLRAPLRAIDGFSNMLLEDQSDKLDSEGKRLLGIVVANTRKMGQLIDDLLRFSRLGRAAMNHSRVDMTVLAQSVFSEVLAACPDRTVEVVIGNLPAAYADPGLLRQVLINLIGNGVKYTRSRKNARIEMEGRVDGLENLYIVRDNGVGFEMQHAQKLFGVFKRLHSEAQFEGTGVGLALVRRIVERHGGRVWAEGKVNEGAAFSFTLPRKENTPASSG